MGGIEEGIQLIIKELLEYDYMIIWSYDHMIIW